LGQPGSRRWIFRTLSCVTFTTPRRSANPETMIIQFSSESDAVTTGPPLRKNETTGSMPATKASASGTRTFQRFTRPAYCATRNSFSPCQPMLSKMIPATATMMMTSLV
jgi:hypothetical protein